MKKQLKKLTASASALTMLAASMSAGGVIASAMEAPESPAASDYTFTIPSTPTVTQAGYNATDGVTAKGTLARDKKLVITADSTDGFALTLGDNKIGYNLVNTDNADTEFDSNAAAPSWEFKELNADGVTQPLGIVVEDFEGKPRGQYTDTVTFTAKLENAIGVADALKDGAEIVLNFNDKNGPGYVRFKNNNGTFNFINENGWFSEDARASVNSSGKLFIEIEGSGFNYAYAHYINTFTFDPDDDTFEYTCGGYGETTLTSLVINGVTVEVTQLQ